MSLSIKVAIPNSLQIALFVIPALVIVGWIIEQLMNLAFEPFGAVVFFLSVIVVERLVADDDSNYLEGVMLVGT
jgi:Ca2+:H+ antiporter